MVLWSKYRLHIARPNGRNAVLTVLTLPCVLSSFHFHGFALICCSICSFTFRLFCRQGFHEAYIWLHSYVVQLFNLRLLWLLLTSHDKSFSTAGEMLQPKPASVRSHGIRPCSFLVYPPDLRLWVTATLRTLLSQADALRTSIYQRGH